MTGRLHRPALAGPPRARQAQPRRTDLCHWVSWLVALLALAACGGPVVTPTRTAEPASQATATPEPSPSPTRAASPPRSTTPRSGRVPPPTPDPAAVAAGAPLRATLLAQVDEYERALCAATPTRGECRIRWLNPESRQRFQELAGYAAWFSMVEQCSYDESGRSPSGYVFTVAGLNPMPEQLREPWRLDVYVSGAEWCGQRGLTVLGTPTR